MSEGTGMTASDTPAGRAPGAGRKKIQVIVPEELDQRLDAVAAEARVTKSELIRQILSAALAE